MTRHPDLRIIEVVRTLSKKEQIERRNDEVREAIWQIRYNRGVLSELRKSPLEPTLVETIDVMPGDPRYEQGRSPKLYHDHYAAPEGGGSAWAGLVTKEQKP